MRDLPEAEAEAAIRDPAEDLSVVLAILQRVCLNAGKAIPEERGHDASCFKRSDDLAL
jgi:hypothetical protein